MSIRITVGADLRARLLENAQTVELCDEDGHVIGRFTPRLDPALFEGLEPNISEEELDRRQQVRTGRSLGEILKDLEGKS